MGEFDRGIRQLTAAAELIPELYYLREQLVHAYIRTGQHDRAMAECDRVAANGGARGAALMAYTLAVGGRIEEARVIADRLLQARDGYQPPTHIAMVLAALGQPDDALTWLERGFAERDAHYVGFHFRYEFQPLHGHPRFEALVRRRP
jgi:tetratricopeptide (TPR) repeat protein